MIGTHEAREDFYTLLTTDSAQEVACAHTNRSMHDFVAILGYPYDVEFNAKGGVGGFAIVCTQDTGIAC